ncbi:unnamed protein product, partial [Ascophyllum nodosum]
DNVLWGEKQNIRLSTEKTRYITSAFCFLLFFAPRRSSNIWVLFIVPVITHVALRDSESNQKSRAACGTPPSSCKRTKNIPYKTTSPLPQTRPKKDGRAPRGCLVRVSLFFCITH